MSRNGWEDCAEELVVLGEKPDLIFGLVAPVGINLNAVSEALSGKLGDAGYAAQVLHLSQLLAFQEGAPDATESQDEYERIKHRMDLGNAFRKKLDDPTAMAGLAITSVRRWRKRHSSSSTPVAYILRSLKRPEEVLQLREVYRGLFHLIAVTAPRPWRIRSLADQIARSRGEPSGQRCRQEAEELAQRDEEEIHQEFGQRLRDTFPLADVFLDVSDPGRFEADLERFLEILFGHPFHTPTVDEFLMFHAWAASLRSADPSRQVGAVIGTSDGQILAVGTNEVPKAGGGFYWPSSCEEGDHRDHVLGRSASHESRIRMVRDCLRRLADHGLLGQEDSPVDEHLVRMAVEALGNSELMNVGEFGRAVHAEMAALTDAARRGVPVQGATLYCTTYPCHVCARHIVAAGIHNVVYVEPYPKSRAVDLHGDSIAHPRPGPPDSPGHRVIFRPHTGIAPRYYPLAFRARERMRPREKPDLVKWSWAQARPVLDGIGRAPDAYRMRELWVARRLKDTDTRETQ